MGPKSLDEGRKVLHSFSSPIGAWRKATDAATMHGESEQVVTVS